MNLVENEPKNIVSRDVVVKALIDLLDGATVLDIQSFTGLSLEQSEELFELFHQLIHEEY